MHVPTPIFGRQNPTVRLCGDGIYQQCGCRRFEHYGAVFDLPYRLELMSDVVLAVEWPCAGCGQRRMRISGIVVGCTDTGDGFFETSVLFLPGSELCAMHRVRTFDVGRCLVFFSVVPNLRSKFARDILDQRATQKNIKGLNTIANRQ